MRNLTTKADPNINSNLAYQPTECLANKVVWPSQENMARFLANRTNGQAFGTMCRPSVVCLWCFVLWRNGTS